MRIYYAHSRQIYGTHRETVERHAIELAFPGAKVTCPNLEMNDGASHYDRAAMRQYLAAVESHDVVVCSELPGFSEPYLSRGTYDEVRHALRRQKPVLVIRLPHFLTVTGTRPIDGGSDKMFGRLTTGTDATPWNQVKAPRPIAWNMEEVAALVDAAQSAGMLPREAMRMLTLARDVRSRLADQLRHERARMREERKP